MKIKCEVRREEGRRVNLEKHFKQNLKASTCIRYGKFGATVITVDMSVNNIQDMFRNFKSSNLKEYMGTSAEE